MKKTTLGLTLLITTAVVMSCSQKTEEAKSSFDLVTAKAEIEQANKEFMAFYDAGDTMGVANSYTVDGKVMNAGAPSVGGKNNIASLFAGMIKSGITKADLKLENVYGSEDLLVEEGVAFLYASDKVVAEEKYIVVWKKEDGKWKLFRDIFNSNLPPN
jgi:ketosteroid isomerase-like protein